MATVVLTFEAKGKVIIKVIIYIEVRHYAFVASVANYYCQSVFHVFRKLQYIQFLKRRLKVEKGKFH